MEPLGQSQDNEPIRFTECEIALVAIDQDCSACDEKLFEMLNNLRLLAQSLESDYSTHKILHGLELAERVAPKVEEILNRAIACLRTKSIEFVQTDGETKGEKNGLPLDAYEVIRGWINQLESDKSRLLEVD